MYMFIEILSLHAYINIRVHTLLLRSISYTIYINYMYINLITYSSLFYICTYTYMLTHNSTVSQYIISITVLI